MPHTRRGDISHAADVTSVIPPSRLAALRHSFAHLVSAIIHPVLFPLLTIIVLGMVYTHNVERALTLAVLAVLLTALPVSLVVFIQVKRGAWSDFDVSRRTQRYTLYPLTLVCAGVLAFVYAKLPWAPNVAIIAVLALLFANVVNGLINLAWKISAHATTAAVCASLLWGLTPGHVWGPPAAAGTLLVGWSRVELGRHTTGQVCAGMLVGVASAIGAILIVQAF